ncbi:MAG: aminodeoxychorismate synthase component I, partial [Pseudomonadota bacterium]
MSAHAFAPRKTTTLQRLRTRDDAGGGIRTTELPYFDNPVEVYRRIRDLGDAVLLDSAARGTRARWDIIAAAPGDTPGLQLSADTHPGEMTAELERFVAAAKSVLAAHRASHIASPALQDWPGMSAGETPSGVSGTYSEVDGNDLPFVGGYIGHLSYELGRRIQGLAALPVATPLASVRYYPWAILQDHEAHRSWLVGDWDESLKRELDQRLRAVKEATTSSFLLQSSFTAQWDLARYQGVFERVKEFIRAGDCYQINIAQPFETAFSGDTLEAYEALRQVAQAPFCAYLPLAGGASLMSLSPERFLTVSDGQVETRPIKGTRPRSADPRADREAAAALLASEKERAENLMIVDLLRNDIGRFCEPGSVGVDELFQLESFATVHHLVSAVRGRLAPGVTALDLLLGCIPGGSITGAPKHRAMQLIDELEQAPRQAWCGSVFYLSAHGRLDSNIAIRTLFSHADRLSCWAGGGLVDDSDVEAEYQEQEHKVGAFLQALEKRF